MVIICEIGQNHCGDMGEARRLIVSAKDNGADLVKFQLYDHKILYKDHPGIPNVELSFDQAKMLFDYGQDMGIEVFFSVFDVERVKWCEEMGVKRYKIACDYSRKHPDVHKKILWTRKPMIVSESDSFMPAMTKSLDLEHIQYLYCVPQYPAELEDLHLENIDFNKTFGGFSDHTIGLDAAKIALARGAQIIEKHFSLCYNIGIDGEWSMTPEDLRELKRWETVCRQCL